MRPPRTALILDGASGAALAVVRSLGRAGWRLRVGAGTRCARSRYAAAATVIPDCLADPTGFADAIAAILEAEPASVIVPCTDASVQILWENEHRLRGAAIMGGDRRSALLAIDKCRTLEHASSPACSWSCRTRGPDLAVLKAEES